MKYVDLEGKLVFTVYAKLFDGNWETLCTFENEEDVKEYVALMKSTQEDYKFKYNQTPFYVRPPYGSTIGDQ